MSEKKEKKPSRRPETEASQIIGFGIPTRIAEAIKVEAVRGELRLNDPLVRVWDIYSERERAG